MSLDRPVGIVGRPSPKASPIYRVLLLAIRGLGRGVFGVPHRGPPLGAAAGRRLWFADWGWIAAGLPHRTWVDPFVVAGNLPIKPRLVSFGDGPAIFRSLWRRLIFRRMGGVMSIWPGGGRAAVDAHLSAASQQPPDRGNTHHRLPGRSWPPIRPPSCRKDQLRAGAG